MDISSIYRNLLGREGDPPGMAFWQGQADNGVNPIAIEAAFRSTPQGQVNAASTQLLGRNMHEEGMNYLAGNDPATVRSRIMGSPEYLTRMLGPSGGAWQDAARASTMNQSLMPGVFGDYTNPLLSDPASANAILFPPTSAGNQMISGIMGGDWIKKLLGIKDDDKKADSKSGGGTIDLSKDPDTGVWVDPKRAGYRNRVNDFIPVQRA